MKNAKRWLGAIVLLTGVFFFAFGLSKSYAANRTASVVVNGTMNVRTGPGTNYSIKQYKSANVSLPNGTQVVVTSEANDSKGKLWYAISFVYNGSNLTGYGCSDYVFINKNQPSNVATPKPTTSSSSSSSKGTYKTVVKTNPISAKGKMLTGVTVRKSAGGSNYKVSKKNVTLKKNASVTVKGQSTKKGTVWFKVTFSYKGVTRTGYVKKNDVKLTCSPNVPAQITGVKQYLNTYATIGKKNKYYYYNKKKVAVKPNQSVKIIGDFKVSGKKYYYISFSYKSATRKAYVSAQYVKLVTSKTTIKVYSALSSEQFERHMAEEGFPESYKPQLRTLHKAHPYWRFNAYHTSMSWANAVSGESKLGVNLIGSYKSAAWKSKAPGAYNASTGVWKAFDGNPNSSSYWVQASPQAIRYYMDPRNFLTENGIYQFECLKYQSAYQTTTGIKAILNNTPFSGKNFTYKSGGKNISISYVNAFKEAAKKSGVSPYHLASRARQEVVTGATTTTTAVSGKNSKYPGIFNFYNIGATHSTNPALNGLKWASSGSTYMRPWNNRYRSIVGGGCYIGSNYINKGQNTIYLEKFNVTSSSTYIHQYMANVEAAQSESIRTKKAYAGMIDKEPLVFAIPVYKDMPLSAASIPQ